MNEIDLLEKQLGIQKDFYDVSEDIEGHVISLSFYDLEYQPFEYEGDFITDLNIFPYLKYLEIEVGDLVITDLSGLTGFQYLECIKFYDCCKVEDISAIGSLVHLERLDISSAGITNIEPIGALKALKTINMPGNRIASIEVLKGHPNLIHVNFSYNQLRDVSAFLGSKGLKSLHVGYNQINDLSFAANFSQMENLSFDKNLVDNLSFLSSLPLLRTLSFCKNPINDISSLSGLSNLEHLSMTNVRVSDLQPLAAATKLTHLYAGHVEKFDGDIISRFSELTSLQLDSCEISDVSFLKPLKKLVSLNLKNNRIENIEFFAELPQLRYVDLENNKISAPFTQLKFYELSRLDLRGNPFGNKIYGHELYEDTARYWFERGDDDKAMGYFFVDAIGKIPLTIYYKKLLATDPEDNYFRLYYVMRCEYILRLLKEEDLDILDTRTHIVDIVKNSDFFNKAELIVSLEENGRNVLNYHKYSEYTSYLNSGKPIKPHPEMLYYVGRHTLNKREHLDELLSLYKQLIGMNHPLHLALYRVINRILSNNFAYTKEERNAYERYRDLLLHANEREIPFFDANAWFKNNYGYYVHDKFVPPASMRRSMEPVQPDLSAWKVLSRILLVAMSLLALLKSCR